MYCGLVVTLLYPWCTALLERDVIGRRNHVIAKLTINTSYVLPCGHRSSVFLAVHTTDLFLCLNVSSGILGKLLWDQHKPDYVRWCSSLWATRGRLCSAKSLASWTVTFCFSLSLGSTVKCISVCLTSVLTEQRGKHNSYHNYLHKWNKAQHTAEKYMERCLNQNNELKNKSGWKKKQI